MTAFVILAHVQIARASGGLTEARVVTATSAVMRATDGALPYVAKTLVRHRTTGYHHHCGPLRHSVKLHLTWTALLRC